MRTGLIARKVGSSRVFTEDGAHVPVTLLHIDGCQVVAHKTRANDGYDAFQLGAGQAKASRVTKAMRGHFAKAKVEPKQKLAEFSHGDVVVTLATTAGAQQITTVADLLPGAFTPRHMDR